MSKGYCGACPRKSKRGSIGYCSYIDTAMDGTQWIRQIVLDTNVFGETRRHETCRVTPYAPDLQYCGSCTYCDSGSWCSLYQGPLVSLDSSSSSDPRKAVRSVKCCPTNASPSTAPGGEALQYSPTGRVRTTMYPQPQQIMKIPRPPRPEVTVEMAYMVKKIAAGLGVPEALLTQGKAPVLTPDPVVLLALDLEDDDV